MPDIFERLASKTTHAPSLVYRVQVICSHPSFHRTIYRRLSSSKDMIIPEDRVTVRRQNGIAISRRCNGHDHAKGNGLVNFIEKMKRARKVAMITQTGTLETKKRRLADKTRHRHRSTVLQAQVGIANWTIVNSIFSCLVFESRVLSHAIPLLSSIASRVIHTIFLMDLMCASILLHAPVSVSFTLFFFFHSDAKANRQERRAFRGILMMRRDDASPAVSLARIPPPPPLPHPLQHNTLV